MTTHHFIVALNNSKQVLSCVLLCIFLLACSDQKQQAANTPTDITSESQALLTLSELLNADDVKQALAVAAEQNDEQAISLWQQRLLDAAEQVNLKVSERKLLEGEQGKLFLAFQGMKTNYQREFEVAFFEFGDVDAVYQQYPAFESLHQQSQDLVIKRNELVQRVAEELSKQGIAPDIATQQARQQWQNMMTSGGL